MAHRSPYLRLLLGFGYRPRVLRLEERTLPSFVSAQEYPAGRNPTGLAIGDLNGDGFAELILANGTKAGTVSVLRNNGDGSYQPLPSP